MNEESLKKVLNVLLDVKASMRDAANTSVIEQLDEVINLIRRCIETENQNTAAQLAVLSALGKVFDKLPSITALLQLLSR